MGGGGVIGVCGGGGGLQVGAGLCIMSGTAYKWNMSKARIA